jgi:hypothetical protein
VLLVGLAPALKSRHFNTSLLLPTISHLRAPCPARFNLVGSTRGSDVTSLTLRGFTYQAVGQLAQRQPAAFAGRTDIAASFFSALATEQPGVRAAVQEATSSLASAFRCWRLHCCCCWERGSIDGAGGSLLPDCTQ